jgi:hypothetical protein
VAKRADNAQPIIRVFPRKTSHTPTDELAFVGEPPLMRPADGVVHVSVAFTWDVPRARQLAQAWGQYYQTVLIGGPALDAKPDGFMPGRYVKSGVTFTTRGCNGHCPWCLVPKREGRLQIVEDFCEGHIIQDNNFLQAPAAHRARVYQMLGRQPRAAVFGGGGGLMPG